MPTQEWGKAAPDTTMAGSDVLDTTGSVDPWTGSLLAPVSTMSCSPGTNARGARKKERERGVRDRERERETER